MVKKINKHSNDNNTFKKKNNSVFFVAVRGQRSNWVATMKKKDFVWLLAREQDAPDESHKVLHSLAARQRR